MIDTITKIYDELTNTFDCYKVTYINSNIVKSVPLDEANSDYQAIQEWIADGGTVIDNPPE
jgi:hypothetical protein